MDSVWCLYNMVNSNAGIRYILMAVTGSSVVGGVIGRSYKNRTRFKPEETRIMAMRGGKKKKKKTSRGGRRRK